MGEVFVFTMKFLSLHSRLHFPIWSRIQSLPPILVRRWQLAEFQYLLNLSYTHVPFYRELLLRAGITPDRVHNLADVSNVPILSKQLFRAHDIRSTLREDLIEKENYIWNQTSGSLGFPFTFAMDSFYNHQNNPHYLKYSEFCKYRSLIWRGVKLPFIVNYMKVAELGVRSPRPNLLFFSLEKLNRDPEHVLVQLENFKPDVLEGFPAIILELANMYAENRHKFNIHIPFIHTRGERLTDADRIFLCEQFGGEIYNRYALSELGVVGIECAQHDGFHLLEESYFVEILDKENNPLPPGTHGRVIVTFFYNNIMPFIRYDTGDYGMIIPETCRCGIPSQRIKIHGRMGDFTIIGKKRLGTAYFEMIIGHYSEHILRFQVAKTNTNSIEVRIVPAPNFSPDVEEKMKYEFRQTISIVPTVVLVESIKRSPNSTKIKVFVDET